MKTQSAPSLLQGESQQVQGFFDLIEQKAGEGNNATFRHTRRTWGVLNDYFNPGTELEVHSKFRRVDGYPCDLCAVLNWTGVITSISEFDSSQRWNYDIPFGLLRNEYAQQSVFVKVIKVSDEFQQGRQFAAESIVRLQPLDSCLHFLRENCNTVFGSQEFGVCIANQELKIPLLTCGEARPIDGGRSVNKVVKCGAQVMDEVPESERPLIEARRVDNPDYLSVSTSIGIILLDNEVRFSVDPRGNFGLNEIGMFFRSTKFQPTT